jgi:hypothetical protein
MNPSERITSIVKEGFGQSMNSFNRLEDKKEEDRRLQRYLKRGVGTE